jgi:hypothetical protein
MHMANMARRCCRLSSISQMVERGRHARQEPWQKPAQIEPADPLSPRAMGQTGSQPFAILQSIKNAP